MKKLSLILISLFFLSNSTFASTYTYSSDPKMFVSELVNDAINKLSDNNLSKEEKATFVENVAIENIDINALGLYALGELRKSTDKNSLENYPRLTDYSSNKFEITDSEKKSSNYTIVKSKIISSDNQPEIKIDWRVYTKNPDKPLIRDLIVEGLSLARTQKEEFSSILNSNNNDINILIAKLEEFING